MKKIDIINNSIVFATNQEKLEILNFLSKNSLFLNIIFFDYNQIHTSFANNYYFYLKNNYNYPIDLSIQIKKYFDYIDIDKIYKSNKLNKLCEIKKALLVNDIIKPLHLHKYLNKTIYTVNEMPIPKIFKPKSIINLDINKVYKDSIELFKSNSVVESCYSIYDKVVSLLEKGVSISRIKILNTTNEDDYYLNKIFFDSKLPIVINKRIKINTHPQVIKLLRMIKESEYHNSKLYLEELLEDKSLINITKAIQNIYNNYLDQDLEENSHILFQLVNNITIMPQKYTNCINVLDIDSFIYDDSSYYLVMNYTDELLPKVIKSQGYLTEMELKEVGFISFIDINKYLEKHYLNLFKGIKNLTLFFSDQSEKKNRLANLKLDRKIKVIEYKHLIKGKTYLNSLSLLAFAKAKYNLNTYYLYQEDYDTLYNTYNNEIKIYNHEFTGIKRSSLDYLLSKHNTLTGAKIESYNLCKFQYLLKYLLKLDNFEVSVNQFLGTISHKILEEYVLNKDLNYRELIQNSQDFPKDDFYKEKVFKKALNKEIEHLISFIKEFHNSTKFKDITPEIKFNIPFRLNKNFLITGVIDKVMSTVDELGDKYFALIDFKLSKKNFKIDEFFKGRMMQLPLYLYAYKSLNSNNAIPLGFYYQTTSLGRYKKTEGIITKNYQLVGVSEENPKLLQLFDPNTSNIKGVRYKNDGLYKSKNVLKRSEIENISKETEITINNMIKQIKEGKFTINPITIKGADVDSISCKYCDFFAICYNKNKKMEVI